MFSSPIEGKLGRFCFHKCHNYWQTIVTSIRKTQRSLVLPLMRSIVRSLLKWVNRLVFELGVQSLPTPIIYCVVTYLCQSSFSLSDEAFRGRQILQTIMEILLLIKKKYERLV